jgi:hypothetical protein
MKSHLFFAATASALLISSAAFAQAPINMNGNISPNCTVLTLAPTSVDLGTISDPTAPGALDASKVNGATASVTPSITCNGGGTTLSIDADPLQGPTLPTNATGSGFSNLVNYTATINKVATGFVQNMPAGISNSTTAAGASSGTVGLIASTFSVNLSGAAAAGILIAGGYSGSVTITLTPG